MVFRSQATPVTPMLNAPQILPALPNAAGGAGGAQNLAGQAARLALTFSRVSSVTGAATAGLGAMAGGLVAVAGPLAAFAIAVGLAGAAVTLLIRRVNRQAQELAPFSGALAAAQARSSVAQLQQQVRSARFLGGDLARFTEAQTRISVAATKILDVIEKVFLQVFNPLLETVTMGTQLLAAFAESVYDFFAKIAALFPDLGIGQLWADIREGVNELVAQGAADAKGDFFNMFIEMPDLLMTDRKAERRRSAPGMDIAAPGFGPLALP